MRFIASKKFATTLSRQAFYGNSDYSIGYQKMNIIEVDFNGAIFATQAVV